MWFKVEIYFLATIWSDSVTIASLRDRIQIEVENQQINVASRRDRKHDWSMRSVRLSQFDGLTCLRIISNIINCVGFFICEEN